MAQIGKEKLDDVFQEELITQLAQLTSNRHPRQSKEILVELLGDTEVIMLAKRLAMVVMYMDDATTYQVEQTLKVSRSTAARIKDDYDQGKFSEIEKRYKTNQKRREFWSAFVRAGMPPIGKGRWKYIDSLLDNEN